MAWSTLGVSPPILRGYAGGASVGQYIYIFNGMNAGGNIDRLDRFDTLSNSWSPLTRLTVAFPDCSMVATNTDLFVFTTWTVNKRYNIATNKWWNILNPPARRDNASSLWDGGNFIYVLGGYSGSNYQRQVYQYNISTNTWLAKTNLPAVRGGGGSFIHNGYMYYVGGQTTTTVTSTVYRALMSNTTWVWNTIQPMPSARTFFGSFFKDDKFWVLGGADTNYNITSSVLIYDPNTNTWDTSFPDMPFPKADSLAFAPSDGKIYLMTGYDGTTYDIPDLVYSFDSPKFYSYIIS